MAFKLFLLVAFMAAVRGGVASASVVAPAVVAGLSDATVDPNPAYSFAYDVQDTLTGDSKTQVESRANGVVKGQYTVADPDGTRRIVDYYADPIHGFNAVVRKTPLAVAAPVVARAVAPAAVAPVVAPAAPLVARSPIVAPAPYAVAPGFARLAAPYAPLAVAPGVAGVAASAPLAVAPGFSRVAAPFLAPSAALGRIAAPYPYLL